MVTITDRTYGEAVTRIEHVPRTDIRPVSAICILVIACKLEIEELPVALGLVAGSPRISYHPIFIYRAIAVPITVAVYREDYRLGFVGSCVKLV